MTDDTIKVENKSDLVMKCRDIIECDTTRISKPLDNMFLVIGFNRNTKDDEGKFVKNGVPYDFNYVAEKTVASGKTDEELLASVREYKRICSMTMEEYIQELIE